MPIEIRELYIKAVVNAAGEKNGATASGEMGGSAPAPSAGENSDQVIEQCVEKVMEILRDKMER